jgi:hypothetical protein
VQQPADVHRGPYQYWSTVNLLKLLLGYSCAAIVLSVDRSFTAEGFFLDRETKCGHHGSVYDKSRTVFLKEEEDKS